MGVRFLLLTIAFGILFGLLCLNLYNLQVQKGGYYINKVQARNEALAQLQLRRGQIFFTDKYQNQITVAQNKDKPVIYANPKEIENVQKSAESLSPILGLPANELENAIDDLQIMFRILSENPTQEQLDAVQELGLPGVYESTKQYRFYPFNNLSAQLLGFVGLNNETSQPKGLYGTEKYYDIPLADGHDIELTIDRNLQTQAEETIEKLVKEQKAESGNVIIEEPKTGKILAIADYPTFDPNDYKNYPVKNFLNSAVQLVYEPGSVFKPITMAAGIDSGTITSDTTYNDKGFVTLNGKKITNWDHKAYGPNTTMTKVIERSINNGAISPSKKWDERSSTTISNCSDSA